MPGLGYQAIILAGGDDKRLHPLTAGTVKALLPVANRPLLSYPLKLLSDAGLKHVFLVVYGDEPAASIQAWVNQEYSGPNKMHCEVIKAPKECHGTADALRAVASKITSRTFVVLSGDLLTDFPVNALVAKHQMNGAVATALLFKRKVSPTTETKPGKAPKNVDYIGLDPSREHLLFYASSPETLRDLKIPLPVVRRYGSISVASDLTDAHLYCFNRSVLNLLHAQPSLSSVRQDLLPFLSQHQLKLRAPADGNAAHSTASGTGAGIGGLRSVDSAPLLKGSSSAANMSSTGGPASEADGDGSGDTQLQELPGAQFMERSHTVTDGPDAAQDSSVLRVHIVPQGLYCARINDAANYGEVNRDLADAKTALHMTGLKQSSQHENVVPASTVIGNKSTIAAACILGEGCTLGDKSSIKRSVLGNNCKLGANVKIINSVLQDGVTAQDGVTIQNSIVCRGATIKERAALKDCQVGADCVVAGGRDYSGEALVGRPQVANS